MAASRRRKASTKKKAEVGGGTSTSGVGLGNPAKEPSNKSTNGASRRKRVSVAPPREPEFVEDKRNLEDLWQAAFPVGTEVYFMVFIEIVN
ncbi:hypothetical protein AXF42_Ash010778 [Apostasia shenzhenica]|uniref:Uncharacterized protein n=1 Tax=Apostasia shenzhenica TaxID=1088818 RepID=A0A2I0A0P3_9ASPA|nr:hypothetical protein AXF42_Ash010778 [Apostasia shenzhenica]